MELIYSTFEKFLSLVPRYHPDEDFMEMDEQPSAARFVNGVLIVSRSPGGGGVRLSSSWLRSSLPHSTWTVKVVFTSLSL